MIGPQKWRIRVFLKLVPKTKNGCHFYYEILHEAINQSRSCDLPCSMVEYSKPSDLRWFMYQVTTRHARKQLRLTKQSPRHSEQKANWFDRLKISKFCRTWRSLKINVKKHEADLSYITYVRFSLACLGLYIKKIIVKSLIKSIMKLPAALSIG